MCGWVGAIKLIEVFFCFCAVYVCFLDIHTDLLGILSCYR